MAGGAVRDRDRGWKRTLRRLFGARRPVTLSVGIHEDKGGGAAKEGADGLTVAQVGAFHEFGLGVPRRSFIADWADENEARHKSQLAKMAKAVAKGAVPSVEVGLERLGNLYVGEVQRRIAAGIDPPLAQSTIDRKGSSVPLIDTGQLRSSITYKVTR